MQVQSKCTFMLSLKVKRFTDFVWFSKISIQVDTSKPLIFLKTYRRIIHFAEYCCEPNVWINTSLSDFIRESVTAQKRRFTVTSELIIVSPIFSPIYFVTIFEKKETCHTSSHSVCITEEEHGHLLSRSTVND